MAPENTDLKMVVARLEKVERQNRRFKLVGTGLLLVMAAALLLGAALPKARVLEAQELIIRDKNNKVRTWMRVVEERGPNVALLDEHGKTRFMLDMNGSGQVAVKFIDPEGNFLLKKTF